VFQKSSRFVKPLLYADSPNGPYDAHWVQEENEENSCARSGMGEEHNWIEHEQTEETEKKEPSLSVLCVTTC